MVVLNFQPANSKLKKLYKNPAIAPLLDIKLDGGRLLKGVLKVYSFSLLAGHSCPFAKLCKARVVIDENGKRRIEDGPDTEFRCYAASNEVRFQKVYDSRKHNFDTLKSLGNDTRKIAAAIESNLPSDAGIIRIHASGAFTLKTILTLGY